MLNKFILLLLINTISPKRINYIDRKTFCPLNWLEFISKNFKHQDFKR